MALLCSCSKPSKRETVRDREREGDDTAERLPPRAAASSATARAMRAEAEPVPAPAPSDDLPRPIPTAVPITTAHGPFPTSTAPAMLDPAKASLKAPKEFSVAFKTTAGDFQVDCFRDWAPKSADRFYNLVTIGYYDDAAFFRVVPGFVAQFGLSSNPAVSAAWKPQLVAGDPVKGENKRGTVAMAMGGQPAQFSTQVFINLRDNLNLGGLGYTPVCQVHGFGMSVVDKLFSGHAGKPAQPAIERVGNSYLRKEYPALDYIVTARLVPPGPGP